MRLATSGICLWSAIVGARLFLIAFLVITGGTIPLQAAESQTGTGAPSGTARMVTLLEEVRRRIPPSRNPFLSLPMAESLKRQIATNRNPSELVPLHFSLGIHRLQAGQNSLALEAFAEVDRLLIGGSQPTTPENLLNLRLNQALAHFRQGELRNCLSNSTSESCLLPIEGHGRHAWKDGSRAALGILDQLTSENPGNLTARWFLNIVAMTLGEYPTNLPTAAVIPPGTFASSHDPGRFINLAGPMGLAVEGLSGGVAIEDFDSDGLLDVVMSSIGLGDSLRYLHNNGDGTFTDRSTGAGFMGLTGGLHVVSTDYNNDGHIDLHVLRGGWMREGGTYPDSLLRNRGDGTFEDVTIAAGLLSFHPDQTAVWFDFDGDGWLDVFVGNEMADRAGRHPCELFRNNRNGTFTEMALGAGLRINAFVKGAAFGDFNNDGRPDLYVSILGRPNLLFRNDGPGAETNTWRFTDVASAAGVQEPDYSFPTWFFDFDQDGNEDLFAAGYRIRQVADVAADYLGLPNSGERSHLFRNRGNGTFEDVSRVMGLDHVLPAMGSNYGDLDNDGWLDFYLGTGDPDLLTLIPNRMFWNRGGKHFEDVTTAGGFGHLQKGHSVSFADLDNDGDQDVYIDMGGAYEGDLARNALFANPGHGNHWVKLRLEGTRANRPGIGARLTLKVRGPSGERTLRRTVSTGGSFGSNPLRQEIGLGEARTIASLRIEWPGSGTVQTFQDLEPDQLYRIREMNPSPEKIPLKTFALPLPTAPMHRSDP